MIFIPNEIEKQKMLSFMTENRYEKMLNILNKRSNYITIIAENFYNPGNVSALIRTIDAIGFTDINILQ